MQKNSVATYLIWGLTMLLGGWMLLWRWLGDRWGWLGMLNAWAEWGNAMLGGLALLGALQGRWWQSGGAAALWLLGVSRRPTPPPFPLLPTLGARGEPTNETEQTAPTTARFKIFVANLYKHNPSMWPHIELIQAEPPDIICVQELQPDALSELEAALGDRYSYSVTRPEEGAYGFGVLSRFPVEETGYWERPGVRPWGQRVRCTLPDGNVVEVYNVHLVPPAATSTLEMGLTRSFRAREAQLRLMQQEMVARGLPACVVGDHNFSDSSDAYLLACEQWQDAWQVAGDGPRWSWPTRHFPVPLIRWNPRMLRLDYCFYNEQLAAEAMRLLTKRTGSDHCPFVVTLQVA